MKKILFAFVGIGAVLILVWAWFKLFPSDETILRNRLVELARTASVSPNDSPFARLADSSRLTEFFTQDAFVNLAEVHHEIGNIHGRDQLREIAAAARANLRQARIQFLDIQVFVRPDRKSATAYLTALADINDEKNAVIKELKFNFVKDQGAWLIARIDTVRVIGR